MTLHFQLHHLATSVLVPVVIVTQVLPVPAARLLYAQRFSNTHSGQWLVRMMDLAEMAKVTSLIREKKICLLLTETSYRYLCGTKTNGLMIYAFDHLTRYIIEKKIK